MIYAIHAVGTEFIKFGRATKVGQRLRELEVGCPFELHILVVADWPNGAESAIHRYLEPLAERGEWFRDGERTQQVIAWMSCGGLEHLQAAVGKEISPKRQKAAAARLSHAHARCDLSGIELRKLERRAWWKWRSEHVQAQQYDKKAPQQCE